MKVENRHERTQAELLVGHYGEFQKLSNLS